MANRFYVGAAAGRWDLNANWSNLSGGAGGFSFPVAGDNAFLDVGSAGNGPTLIANAVCDQLDCAGFTGTLNLGGFTLQVNTTLFRLAAAMTFTPGAAVPAVDFVAAAGTVLITSAGKSLGIVRCGNAGAGGTYRLQDALACQDLDLVNGTFQFNNQNAVVSRDLYCRATMLAAGCALGSGTIEVQRDAEFRTLNVVAAGTSTFRMTGTGAIRIYGNTGQSFYNLYAAAPGQVTTISQNVAAWGQILVGNILTTGAGTIGTGGPNAAWLYSLAVLYRTGGPATPINMDPATVMTFAPSIYGLALQASAAGQAGTFTFTLPTVLGCPFYIIGTGNGATTFLLGRTTTTASFTASDSVASGGPELVSLNGFNLTTAGDCTSAPAGGSGMAINVGANILAVGRDLILDWCINTGLGYYMLIGNGGTVNVARDFAMNRLAGATRVGIYCVGTAAMSVGRNWDTANANNLGPTFHVQDVGAVTFGAAGAFTIASRATDLWPSVVISGGGNVNLPNGFNCLALAITAGLVVAGNPFTVRTALTNGGTFTGGPNMYIGSSFVNTGVVVMAGTAFTTVGPIFSLSGVNPVTLNMGPQTQRLQLLSAMNITTFTILPRQLPGVVQMLAAGVYNVGTLNSQIATPDAPVQFVSSVAGTRYAMSIGVATSVAHIWPRDWDATGGIALVGDLTNKGLGNNVGWTLNGDGQVRVIEEDPGRDQLAAGGVGPMQYCWLVGTSLINLTAVVAAFAAGADNFHRKTNITFAVLDNLNIGTQYWVGLGMIDDRGRRLAPNMVAGDFATALATAGGGGGGGAHPLFVSVKGPFLG